MTRPSYAQVAGLMDHALLAPTLTDDELRKGCQELREFPIATVCIKPHAVKLALEELAGTQVRVCTVIGFPHGTPASAVKAFEADQAFLDGASEVDMVINTGKALGGDWDYVREDIAAVVEVTRRHNGAVKVIFETDFLPDDRHKVRLCEICSEVKVDFVKTSTGFGFVRGKEGGYDYCGATDHDLMLMRKHCVPDVGVKASGGVRNLDRALEVIALGVTRIGTGSAPAILREYRARFGA